jgi:hypothetical protein
VGGTTAMRRPKLDGPSTSVAKDDNTSRRMRRRSRGCPRRGSRSTGPADPLPSPALDGHARAEFGVRPDHWLSRPKPSLRPVRDDSGVVDPYLELRWIEPQVAAPLDVGNAPFSHESANVPDAHAEHLGDALDVKQKRQTTRTVRPRDGLCSGSPVSGHVPCMRLTRLENATTHRCAPSLPKATLVPSWRIATPLGPERGNSIRQPRGVSGPPVHRSRRTRSGPARRIGTTPAQPRAVSVKRRVPSRCSVSLGARPEACPSIRTRGALV